MSEILLVTQFFPPETGAGARRVGAMARALAEEHDVTVLAPLPGYPSPELFREVRTERLDGPAPYRVRRMRQFPPHRRSLVARALAELGLALRMAAAALGEDCDLLIVSTPSMFLAPALLLVAKGKAVPFVWDLRDFTWRYPAAVAGARWPSRFIGWLLEGVMVRVLHWSDWVTVATPGLRQALVEQHRLPGDKVETFLNGVSRGFFEAFEGSGASLGDPPRVLYLGLMGRNHGVGVLAEVAELLPAVDFMMVGDGPDRAKLETLKGRLGLDNLRIEGYCVDPDSIANYYRDADILFNQTRSAPILNETVLPAKLFEYMATGKPIVYAGQGLAAGFLREAGTAVVVPPGDAQAIAKAVEELLKDPRRRQTTGTEARRLVGQKYLREDLMDQFVQHLTAQFGRESDATGVAEG